MPFDPAEIAADEAVIAGATEGSPSIEELHRLFSYNPDTGVLAKNLAGRTHKSSHGVGSVVGCPDSHGRLRCWINGRTFPVHVICFALHYGEWPKFKVDHRNQKRADNRIENLREATNSQNNYNRRNWNKLAKGVTLHRGRYEARITSAGVTRFLGASSNLQEAAELYRKASAETHGEFSCLE